MSGDLWQIAMHCDMLLAMPKSVRISDGLYDLATGTASLMHRSLAQQIEHWAALGQALEASGNREAILSAAIAHMHELDRLKVASGQKKSSELHAIPARAAKRMKYKLHPQALAAFDIKR